MKSYFKNLRKFHNSIKRNLYNKYTKNASSLLELAVGKGGDLDKWCSNNIKTVVGYDINQESTTECKKRVKNKKECKTKVQVYTKDLSVNVIVSKFKFDVVSAMFSFHYFFKNKSSFETIATSIKRNLKKDGLFIGCFFDGELVNNFIENNTEPNGVFEIKKAGNFKKSLFGNKISVYIKGTVLDKPEIEYLVDFEKFVKKMQDLGFQLIDTELFIDLYDNKYNLSKQEQMVSFLNRTFVFKLI